MELVEGQTLRQLVRPGGLPFRKLLEVGIQMAEGLARAHEAGIVHRDLKPENVMVTPDGIVKILDFGLAKLTRSPLERGAGPDEGTLPLPTQPGVLLGTVRYMSPEQASGSVADFRADQFSFGSVLYEMATGQPAFQKGTTVDTLSAILHDEPEPLTHASPKTPAPLRWIIERCLAKDPKIGTPRRETSRTTSPTSSSTSRRCPCRASSPRRGVPGAACARPRRRSWPARSFSARVCSPTDGLEERLTSLFAS